MSWLFSILRAFLLIPILLVTKIVYNLFFHPLKDYPGPLTARASRAYYAYFIKQGTLPFELKKLHDQYGPVVRIAPDELSYNDLEAFNDIYGEKHANFEKDMTFYITPPNEVDSIITAKTDVHRRFRRLLSAPLSEKALSDQEQLITSQISLLMNRLHGLSKDGKQIDLKNWFTCTSFDVLGDLAFGEPFGCLQEGKLHSWITLIHDAVSSMGDISNFKHFTPALFNFLMLLATTFGAEAIKRQQEQFNWCATKAGERLKRDTNRPDFMTYIQRAKKTDPDAMNEDEIMSNSQTLIAAGSETTAATLTGLCFHLMKTPEVYKKLVSEIRSTFPNEGDITLLSTQKLKYLNATIQEGLRVYPAVACAFPRQVPPQGAMIAGKFVAGGYSVGVTQWATYRSKKNFAEPDVFVPERWLGDERFAGDKKDALQPFLVGPRNCIGKNLAYAELRLIMSRLLWNFDLELQSESRDWDEPRKVILMLWDQKPLLVKLKPVVR